VLNTASPRAAASADVSHESSRSALVSASTAAAAASPVDGVAP